MIDTEVLEALGAAAEARLTTAYGKMTAAGEHSGLLRRVLTDQLSTTVAAARIDGDALAIRQLRELGIEVAPDYGHSPSTRAGRRAAAKDALAERARFAKAVDTILADGETEVAVMRLGRMALAETIEAARDRVAEVMRGQKRVEGWTRQTDSDPCELCQWWARDGRVWPASHEMPTHKGCACAQRFTVRRAASIRMVSAEGQRASAARAEAGSLEERRSLDEGAYSRRARRGRRDDQD